MRLLFIFISLLLYVTGEKAGAIRHPAAYRFKPPCGVRQIVHRKTLLDTITQFCVIVCK
jgi:hypothetical protein